MISLYRGMLLAGCLLLSTAGFAQGGYTFGEEPKVSYSGVREMVTSEGTINLKEYNAPGKQRVEMEGPTGPIALINRRDKNVAWMMMPSMGMYMEISSMQFNQQAGGDVKIIEQSKVGSETLDGHKVDKYKSIFEDAKGNRGGGYYWVTADGIPIKMDMVFKDGKQQHRIVMQLKELKVGAQPDSLFEIPPGYNAIPAMGAKMFQ